MFIIKQDVVATCVLEVRDVLDPIESQSDVGGCVGWYYFHSDAYFGAIRDRGAAAFVFFGLFFTFFDVDEDVFKLLGVRRCHGCFVNAM